MVTPISKNIELIEQVGDKKTYHLYGGNKYFYDTEDFNKLKLIDGEYKKITTGAVQGNCQSRNRNTVKAKLRKTGSVDNFLCLIPREVDAEVFVSIKQVIVNDVEVVLNVNDLVTVNDNLDSYGGFLVFGNKAHTRVLYPSTPTIKSFKLVYKIVAKGCNVVENKNYFNFYKENRYILSLAQPKLFDTSLQMINFGGGNVLNFDYKMKHSLVNVDKGVWEYTKESIDGFSELKVPDNYYIDVDIVYGTTADGYVWLLGYPGTWADGVARSTGDSVSTTDASVYYCPYVQYDAAGNVYINRYFGYFDLSALGGSITAATFNIKTKTQNATGGSLFQGTQAATLAVEDFDSFTGSSFGSASWAVDGNWNVITINAGGLSYLTSVLGSTAKLCLREKDYDVAVVQPPTSNPYYNGIYFADSVGNEPYLEMTLEATPPPPAAPSGQPVMCIF